MADISAFCRVADLGSITAAAKALGETKGSVSRRVSRLERALGTPLVQRYGNRLAITEDGVTFREKAGRALELLGEAAAAVRDSRLAPTGHLRVTAATDIGTMLVAPLLAGFGDAWPGVTVELLLTDRALPTSEFDVALRVAAGLPDSALIAHRLGDMALDLVAAPAYLARRAPPAHPDDLAAHRLALIPLRGPVTPLPMQSPDGRRVDVVLRGHVLCRDMLFLREAAVNGAGIAVLPRHLADRDVAAGRLVRVLEDWRVDAGPQLYLLHHGGSLPPKVRVFRDHVRDAVLALRGRCG